MRERPTGVEHVPDDRVALDVELARLPRGGFQRFAQTVFGGLVPEEHAEKPLDLDDRWGRLGAEPLLQCGKAFRRDRVARALATRPVDHLRGGVPALDEPLEFRIEVGIRAWPEKVEATAYLGDDLVCGPRLQGQQAEQRERGGRRLRRHPLTILQCGVTLCSTLEYGGVA